MSGELNRINPTVVEGAEDIFGADDRLIAAGSKRPGFWSSRVSGNRKQLTPAQLAKFQRQNKFKKSARANASRAESFEGQGCGCGGGNCQCAENFEARTYRKSPSRGKTPTSRGKTAGKERRMNLREWKSQWATEPTQELKLWMLKDFMSVENAINGIETQLAELLSVKSAVMVHLTK